MAADVDRVEPLERGHARTRRVLHGPLDGLDPRGGVLGELLARLLDAGRLGEPRHVGEHLAEGGRVERDHLRLRGQPLGHRAHVVERDGADLAHRLRDDQVHAELLERVLVELVQRLAAAGALAHRGVDLGGGQALGNHAAGEVGELFRAGRVVTLVRDRGDAVAEAEREQHLGRGRNE